MEWLPGCPEMGYLVRSNPSGGNEAANFQQASTAPFLASVQHYDTIAFRSETAVALLELMANAAVLFEGKVMISANSTPCYSP